MHSAAPVSIPRVRSLAAIARRGLRVVLVAKRNGTRAALSAAIASTAQGNGSSST